MITDRIKSTKMHFWLQMYNIFCNNDTKFIRFMELLFFLNKKSRSRQFDFGTHLYDSTTDINYRRPPEREPSLLLLPDDALLRELPAEERATPPEERVAPFEEERVAPLEEERVAP